jgi:hypothetical protein
MRELLAIGLRQQSRSWFRVPRDSQPHCATGLRADRSARRRSGAFTVDKLSIHQPVTYGPGVPQFLQAHVRACLI